LTHPKTREEGRWERKKPGYLGKEGSRAGDRKVGVMIERGSNVPGLFRGRDINGK